MSENDRNAARATVDRKMLLLAARAGLRGVGYVEPNPTVGCVIGSRRTGAVLGIGFHRRFGGAHAEVEALRSCETRGVSTRGATAWVTLEPCSRRGKTPPCTDALLDAGISEVVVARRDPTDSGGGLELLDRGGVRTAVTDVCAEASRLGEPFSVWSAGERPWVIAKWAQTIDGRIATRTGASKWLSGERSRRLVHRLRGVSGGIMTGMGTVVADDPQLTARGVTVRRAPIRLIIDPEGETPADRKLVVSALSGGGRTVIATTPEGAERLASEGVRGSADGALRVAAVGGSVGSPEEPDAIGCYGVFVTSVLRYARRELGVSTLLVEAGGGLLGAMFGAGVVDAALVFVTPRLFGDDGAKACVRGLTVDEVAEGVGLELWWSRARDGDVQLMYGVRRGRAATS